MKLQKYKKLDLITLVLFILTFSIMTIGLILIAFSNLEYFTSYSDSDQKLIIKITDGFSLLNYLSINYILNYSAEHMCSINNNYEGYYDWIQLQIGVIICIILVPILAFFTLSLTFLIIGLKIKITNNNFWDALEKCEIINNYYIH